MPVPNLYAGQLERRKGGGGCLEKGVRLTAGPWRAGRGAGTPAHAQSGRAWSYRARGLAPRARRGPSP